MDAVWSVLAMPIGVFLCFSPVVLAWILAGAGLKERRPDEKQRR
jgi:hypothetical protein